MNEQDRRSEVYFDAKRNGWVMSFSNGGPIWKESVIPIDDPEGDRLSFFQVYWYRLVAAMWPAQRPIAEPTEYDLPDNLPLTSQRRWQIKDLVRVLREHKIDLVHPHLIFEILKKYPIRLLYKE